MKMLIFMAYAFFLPNPYDEEGRGYEVPPQYAAIAYYHASQYDDVEPEEMLGILLVEHGSHGRWIGSDSVGDDDSSYGLYQIRKGELGMYKEEHPESDLRASKRTNDLLHWWQNTKVAAWLIHRHKRQHARKGYCNHCRGKARQYCRAKVYNKEDGTTVTEYRKPQHTWTAHWKCGPKDREFKRGCESRRNKVMRHLSSWKDNVVYRLVDSLGKGDVETYAEDGSWSEGRYVD
jgi:hypothetical protein